MQMYPPILKNKGFGRKDVIDIQKGEDVRINVASLGFTYEMYSDEDYV